MEYNSKNVMMGAFVAVVFFMSGCAGTEVRRDVNYNYPPLGLTAEVQILDNAAVSKLKFEVLAVLVHDDPGKYQMLTLEDAIIPLKIKAREVGANALIIDTQSTIYSGIVSRGIHAEARAIKLE